MIGNQIRHTSVALIKTALPNNVNVYNSKISPMLFSQFPSASVYLTNVNGNVQDTRRPAFTSQYTLEIDVIVEMNDTWADEAEQYMSTIKGALFNDSAWLSQFVSIDHYSVDYSIIADSSKPLGSAVLTITASVFEAY